jgi:hypothetical protein
MRSDVVKVLFDGLRSCLLGQFGLVQFEECPALVGKSV